MTEAAKQFSVNENASNQGVAQYFGRGDPALKDYYPLWLDNMADDVTVEGSMLDGAVQGLRPSGRSCLRFARCMTARNISSPAPTETVVFSKTTSPRFRANRSAVSS